MSKRPLIVVTDHLIEAGVERPILDAIADLKILHTTDEAVVARAAPEADVLLVFHDIRLSERCISQMHHCKGIIRCGVGFDNIDLEAAGRRGIVVCNVPDYGTEEVADHALMMLLAGARRLMPCDQDVRSGNWRVETIFGAPRLRGRTLGIIGCGRIGTAMVLRAKVLGLRVVIHDPYRPDGVEKGLGVERCYRLDELLPQCDFVSLHCPLTTETHHLLNARTLALLPKGAHIINTARGGCIDLGALRQALDSGQIGHAALDVVEREPLDDEAIRRHPRVILTPHVAFYAVEAFNEMRTKGAIEARRIVQGEPVRNPVNLHLLTNPRAVVS